MFNSDSAAAALLSNNNVANFIALTGRNRTADQLQALKQAQFAANAGLAQTAMEQMGSQVLLDKRLEYENEIDSRNRRDRRRELALRGLASLGSSFAGNRLGVDLNKMPMLDANALLARINQRSYELSNLMDPNPEIAPYMAQIASSARGMYQQ